MSQRFTEEFKIQAVKQVTDQGYSVASVSERLGVTSSSLYNWIKARLKNYPIKLMCEELSIQRSGFYAWVNKPKSKRQLEDERLMGPVAYLVKYPP